MSNFELAYLIYHLNLRRVQKERLLGKVARPGVRASLRLRLGNLLIAVGTRLAAPAAVKVPAAASLH